MGAVHGGCTRGCTTGLYKGALQGGGCTIGLYKGTGHGLYNRAVHGGRTRGLYRGCTIGLYKGTAHGLYTGLNRRAVHGLSLIHISEPTRR